MDKIISQYLNSVIQLNPKLDEVSLEYFRNGLTVSKFPSKHFYIQANVIQKDIGYVHSGLLRVFYIDDYGNEKTVNFTGENNYASHYTNLAMEKPSKFYFQCIEPSVIVNISYLHIQDCCDKFPAFDKFIRLVVEEAHRSLLSRMEGFIFGNAKSRYLNFVEENPDLLNRIPLTYLCSYLGMERQSLTRIRKKLIHK